MQAQNSPPPDSYKIRCPRLGHQISFSYCRWESGKVPCFKTLDCWWEHFQVVEYLAAELTPDQWQSLQERRPKPKMTSLMEIIAQAKENRREE